MSSTPVSLRPSSARPAGRVGSVAGDAVVVSVLGFLSVATFFRQQILNGFTVLSGDRYDGMIETSILEHWYNVFRFKSAFNVTNYFYPTPDTLGYNDGYFIYGMIYSVFRALGLNPFVASESVNITLLTIGYLGFTWCAATVMRLSLPVAAFAAALFALSGNIFLQLGHAQLLSVCFAPVLTALLYRCVSAAVARKPLGAAAYGTLAGALHAAWLLTAFYMAWYILFAGTCFAAAALACGWRRLPAAWAVLRDNRFAALGVATFYVLVNVPFLLIYLPKARETGQHPYEGVFVWIPSVLDVFNIGPDNLIFGRSYALLNKLIRPDFPDYGEKATGFPPLLLLVFGLGVILALQRGRKAGPEPHRLAMLFALGTLLSWICVLRVGDHTLCGLIYGLVPGARTVRVVARYQIFLSFPVTLLAGYYLQQRWWPNVTGAVVIAAVLLAAEQLSVQPTVNLKVGEELGRLTAVPPAPKSCGSFYVSASREDSPNPDGTEGFHSHNDDAMMLAEFIGLPTLNGFSTFEPRGWNLIRPNERERYLADVRTYAAAHGVTNLCSLNLHTRTWTTDALARP